MRSCCCVCFEWNLFISTDNLYRRRKNSLDVYDDIESISTFNLDEEGDLDPYGIFTMPDERTVLLSIPNRGKILLFDTRKQTFAYCFGSYGSRSPGGFEYSMGISVYNNRIFVADSLNERIQVFDLDYQFTSIIHLEGHSPKSICHSKKGEILLTTYLGEIVRVSLDGRVSNITRIPPHSQGFLLGGICIDSLDRIIVSNKTFDGIQIFSQDGQLLDSFKIDLCNSIGVCVDPYDNILVACGHNICIFTPSGKLVRRISAPNTLYDLCIVGREIIATGDYCIYIYS